MKTYEKAIFILFFVFLLYIFVYKFWLIQIPEWFPNAYELGDIFYGLAFAYITSFIFYLLVTTWPQQKQKKNVYKYVNYKVELILINLNDILGLTSLTDADIKFLDGKISKEEYSSLILMRIHEIGIMTISVIEKSKNFLLVLLMVRLDQLPR